MEAFTKRNVAKYIVTALVAGKTAGLTRDAIADHTRFDRDDTVVEIVGTVVGWGVSQKVKPYTDRAVDKTADWYTTRKDKKNQDKTENE